MADRCNRMTVSLFSSPLFTPLPRSLPSAMCASPPSTLVVTSRPAACGRTTSPKSTVLSSSSTPRTTSDSPRPRPSSTLSCPWKSWPRFLLSFLATRLTILMPSLKRSCVTSSACTRRLARARCLWREFVRSRSLCARLS
ncbi:hypothetical protein CGRA01v4_08015 [Colletotrichum graminicola]|nr:hypothetical protein CGRA01v4_08015 [Colletotrichum graminicola]